VLVVLAIIGLLLFGDPMAASVAASFILPGSLVTVRDSTSIYHGYKGIVQRLSGERVAVLFEGGCWDKLVTLPLRALALGES
jgi:hypothetical protein